MNTFESIYKLFQGRYQDFFLSDLFKTKPDIARDIYKCLLLNAIPSFSYYCVKSLNCNETTETFDSELDLDERVILAMCMKLIWLERNKDDVEQMNLQLYDNEYKRHSENSNLIAKSENYELFREQVNQQIINYTLTHYGHTI